MFSNFKLSSVLAIVFLIIFASCKPDEGNLVKERKSEVIERTAEQILGNPNYQAISYGGYRYVDHSIEPTLEELKEDMLLLSAMGIKILRTYKLHKPQAANLLQAIRELKMADPEFEMYVMLGVWINCEGAFTANPNHDQEDEDANREEIEKAVILANKYDDIVKIIAVGNEAMVKWAASYFVQPGIILRWVSHLQELKSTGKLPKDLWITSSDNFASWGGGGSEYHVSDLEDLIRQVDYVSLHTYPMHDSHYNPAFWGVEEDEETMSDLEKVDAAMLRAKEYAMSQYQSVVTYLESLGIEKPVHIGETGWASMSNGFYGPDGSKACDEYKEALYYRMMREWTNKEGIACFYFEAFNEPWKDAQNQNGSENHFGLFTVAGQAKYALWEMVDNGVFDGLTRNGNSIIKTYQGDIEKLLTDVEIPPLRSNK